MLKVGDKIRVIDTTGFLYIQRGVFLNKETYITGTHSLYPCHTLNIDNGVLDWSPHRLEKIEN